ncbi:Ger(x)C family spore germination protein [Bacillus sp. CGMCC 1.16541]|uniref:Ger(x)C family spore germination protein n=1 Tax=Bacillus sp. CGMCC 1.16541 TaxID=2185143 RepID=UPI000D7253E1|nr:Ger(x)C family spore germination protein [Bacillus sp. CGMCC 1.16541]
MKHRVSTLVVVLLAMSLLSGCADKINLEDATMILMLGIDMNEEGKLVFYSSSPTFDEELQDKNEVYDVPAHSIKEAREEFDSLLSGITSKGKLQILFVGKKVLEQKEWIQLLDTIYRDSFSSISSRIIGVEGDVQSLMYSDPEGKKRLYLYMTKLLETGAIRHVTKEVTLQQFQFDYLSKGKTAIIPMVRMGNGQANLQGYSLLNQDGELVMEIDQYEGQLLQLIQDVPIKQLAMTTILKEEKQSFENRLVSYNVESVERDMKVRFKGDTFLFNLNYTLPISITEVMNDDINKDRKKFTKDIERALTNEFAQLIDSLQENEVDPIGLGKYARAFQYRKWEKVEDDWGKAFKEATVKVKVKVDIKEEGLIRRPLTNGRS